MDLNLDFCLFAELCGSSSLLRIQSCLIYTVVLSSFTPMDGWVDGADGWIGHMDGWIWMMDDRMDGWMNGWIDRAYGWMNG